MADTPSSQAIAGTYDTVVISAGNGGSAAAAQLAAKGARVLLPEQHNLAGGFATSFVRGRFEFEAALHLFCDVGPPGAPRGFRRVLEGDPRVHLDFGDRGAGLFQGRSVSQREGRGWRRQDHTPLLGVLSPVRGRR